MLWLAASGRGSERAVAYRLGLRAAWFLRPTNRTYPDTAMPRD